MATPPANAAGADLPVGRADGVVIKWKRNAMVVVFSKRVAPLYRRIAGREIRITCERERRLSSVSMITGFRAPRRGRTLRLAGMDRADRDWDYCRVWIPGRAVKRRGATTHYPADLIVTVPLTQAGAVYVDEQNNAFALADLLTRAAFGFVPPFAEGYMTPAKLIEETGGRMWSSPFSRSRPRLVALASPADTPPPGSIGYYSDGGEHGAAVTVTAAGHRLYLELAPDDAIHANVLSTLHGGLGTYPGPYDPYEYLLLLLTL